MKYWTVQRQMIGLASLLVMFLILGCGGPTGPKRYPVSGSVTREGIDVDSGQISFLPTGSGPASSALIKDGKYRFTKVDGLPEGSYKVKIIQEPLRDATYQGKKNEAPLLPDDRFKGKMPANGWMKEATVASGQVDPIDFSIEESDGPAAGAGGRGKSK